MKFILHTKEPTFLEELREETPDGITVVDAGKREILFDDISATVDISFNIELVIDLAKIAPWVVLAWLARKAESRKRNSYINIEVEGKEFPVNDADTIKLL